MIAMDRYSSESLELQEEVAMDARTLIEFAAEHRKVAAFGQNNTDVNRKRDRLINRLINRLTNPLTSPTH